MTDSREKENAVETAAIKERKAPPGLVARSLLLEEKRPEEKLLYGFKGGIIAFVDHDGQLYITPGTRLKIEILESCGFKTRRPQIEVPYSDGSTRSKRWLRKALPRQEILRSVAENNMPKVDGRVMSGIMKAGTDGLRELDTDFLRRCARVEEKFYYYVGLAAGFRGILSFTDQNAVTWVTPFSEQKKSTLEQHGYTWVESMIKVPYALENKENRNWLASHIALDEWSRTENEVRESKANERMEKARKKIEELGLKEIPPELLGVSAVSGEKLPGNVGMAGAHNGILAFTDPDGATWVTPATNDKVELLKSLGYQFMGSAIKVPRSLKTPEDIAWLQEHIPASEWDKARESNQIEARRREEEMTEKVRRALDLKDLPAELVERSFLTETKLPKYVGQFFVRNDILGFVYPNSTVYVTPAAPSKVDLLKEANYKAAHHGFPVPYSDRSPGDMEFLVRHLTQAEFDRCLLEREKSRERLVEERKKRIIEQRELKELPEEFMKRCSSTQETNIELIGYYCSRGGVTCFIDTEGVFIVTPYTPSKEEILREAGYTPPDRLIRVPYGSESEQDLKWLRDNLPPGELERSKKENEEIEHKRREKELEALRGQKKISEKAPEALVARSAETEEEISELIGSYILQGEWLGFVGPDGKVWITPHTEEKVEILKQENYQYSHRRFALPHTSEKSEDRDWRKEHLPSGEMERSTDERQAAEVARLDQMAGELAARRETKALPEDITSRSAMAGKVSPQMIGRYLERNQFIYTVNIDRTLYITPTTPDKKKVLGGLGYQYPEKIEHLPYFSDNPEDLGWIRENLPEGELERCEKQRKNLEEARQEDKVKTNMAKFKLKTVPEKIQKRGVDSGKTDPKNIGRLGEFRGVLAWVAPDERVFIAWYTTEKQEALEDCGYKLEGYMPIKVPYAMADIRQRRWLLEHLPEPDDEEQISVDENAENL